MRAEINRLIAQIKDPQEQQVGFSTSWPAFSTPQMEQQQWS